MTIAAPAIATSLPLRFAWRELRGGLGGFRVFIACIALGVMEIAGVGSFAGSLTEGLARQGQVILGGDVAFSLIQREASDAERSFLAAHGTVSVAATLRAMARTPPPFPAPNAGEGKEGATLVEVKAVDAAYPLFGEVALEPAMPLADALARQGDAFGAAADPTLLLRLDLKPGDRITIGTANIELRAALKTEPDKLAGGIGFGPRVLMSEAALRATGLIQPGSLVRWHYRLRLPGNDAGDSAAAAVVEQAKTQLPDAGWEVRTSSNASPQLERSIERFSQYLTLVGLTALLVGGVGVANAVKSHLDRKRDVIGTLKAVGATGGDVFAIYLVQILLVALIASIIGAALGATLPYLIVWTLATNIPLPVSPALHPGVLALSIVYGLLTALAFALWPLARAQEVSVATLFRDMIGGERRWPHRRYVVATGLIVAALAALAILLAYDRRIAAIFVASAAVVFLVLRFVAMALMWGARRLPSSHSTVLRLAIANIHRPGALTPSLVLSLGLGLALLVTVVEIDGNLRREFTAALPDRAPSFFFLDIPAADAERFDGFVHDLAPRATLERVPMLRGRVVSANGIKAEDLKPDAGTRWVLQSDRGITYGNQVPAGSHVVAGEWWGADYDGPPLVSLENKTAEGLHLKLGDPITVNVLGRNITATIANLRTVDWQSLGINFVLVFSPGTFRGAPHTHIATLTYPDGGTPQQEATLLKALADAFPTVTALRVKDAIDAVGGLVANLVLVLRGASGLTLVVAALVLGGALAAGHRMRVYDAVVLKTLGATRARLVAAYAIEYALLGLATALFGVAAGSLAADLVVSRIMEFPFVFVPGPAATAALGAVAVTVVLGLAGTFSALGQKPAPLLRNL
jgi:putative ABC transport system permease protein